MNLQIFKLTQSILHRSGSATITGIPGLQGPWLDVQIISGNDDNNTKWVPQMAWCRGSKRVGGSAGRGLWGYGRRPRRRSPCTRGKRYDIANTSQPHREPCSVRICSHRAGGQEGQLGSWPIGSRLFQLLNVLETIVLTYCTFEIQYSKGRFQQNLSRCRYLTEISVMIIFSSWWKISKVT